MEDVTRSADDETEGYDVRLLLLLLLGCWCYWCCCSRWCCLVLSAAPAAAARADAAAPPQPVNAYPGGLPCVFDWPPAAARRAEEAEDLSLQQAVRKDPCCEFLK